MTQIDPNEIVINKNILKDYLENKFYQDWWQEDNPWPRDQKDYIAKELEIAEENLGIKF